MSTIPLDSRYVASAICILIFVAGWFYEVSSGGQIPRPQITDILRPDWRHFRRRTVANDTGVSRCSAHCNSGARAGSHLRNKSNHLPQLFRSRQLEHFGEYPTSFVLDGQRE